MRFEVTTLVKLRGNFSLKSQMWLKPVFLFCFHISGSIYGCFFCYNLACETGRNMEMSHSWMEEVCACLHAFSTIPCRKGYLKRCSGKVPPNLHQVKINGFSSWSDTNRTSLGVIHHHFPLEQTKSVDKMCYQSCSDRHSSAAGQERKIKLQGFDQPGLPESSMPSAEGLKTGDF